VAEESQSPDEGTGGDSVATLPEDPIRQPVLDALKEHLGDDLVGSELANDDLWVRVNREAWRSAVQFCRDQLGMTYFCFLSGLDWMPNPDLLAEKEWEEAEGTEVDRAEVDKAAVDKAEVDKAEVAPSPVLLTGVAGGETRFQVFARLYSIARRVGVTLKADLPDGDLRIDSLVPLFRGADWHEREAWEMYGFQFVDHPGLRHLYLPTEF
jgi:NADH-quinone oxidoreductase subunit C